MAAASTGSKNFAYSWAWQNEVLGSGLEVIAVFADGARTFAKTIVTAKNGQEIQICEEFLFNEGKNRGSESLRLRHPGPAPLLFAD